MKNKIFRYFFAPLTLLVILGIYLLGLQLSGNFHEAIPNELYRSAQLHPGDLTRYAKKYHIQSVLNLRGEHVGAKWYDSEVEEAAEAGIEYVNYKMSSKKKLTKKQAISLIETMKSMPKPLLIHCQSGADRTGLASALYVAGVAKQGEFEAELQLSLLYGHVPLWFTKAYAMNNSFEALEPYLGFGHS